MNKKNRKLRIYIKQDSKYLPFCWVELLQDGSFSFGLSSKRINFKEYGSAILKSGRFTDHKQTITKGKIKIKAAKAPHATFHPPGISQQSGIVNFTTTNGKIDTWALDWFPVRQKQQLAYITVDNFKEISNSSRPKKQYRVVSIPKNLQSFIMILEINKRNTPITKLHDNNTISNTCIFGYSPNYIVALKFYKDNPKTTSIYIASDNIIKA